MTGTNPWLPAFSTNTQQQARLDSTNQNPFSSQGPSHQNTANPAATGLRRTAEDVDIAHSLVALGDYRGNPTPNETTLTAPSSQPFANSVAAVDPLLHWHESTASDLNQWSANMDTIGPNTQADHSRYDERTNDHRSPPEVTPDGQAAHFTDDSASDYRANRLSKRVLPMQRTSTTALGSDTLPPSNTDDTNASTEPEAKCARTGDRQEARIGTNAPYAKGIITPGEVDILCGRGGATNYHPGNCYSRDVIKQHKSTYKNTARKRDKKATRTTLLTGFHAQGRRFLKYDSNTMRWNEIPDNDAMEKIGHALREQEKKPVAVAQTTAEPTAMPTQSVGINTGTHTGTEQVSLASTTLRTTFPDREQY